MARRLTVVGAKLRSWPGTPQLAAPQPLQTTEVVQRRCFSATMQMSQPAGPDAPQAGGFKGLPAWRAGWHDHLQYHFFCEGLFVQARLFMTPSLEETSVWVFDHAEGKIKELYQHAEPLEKVSTSALHVRGPALELVDSAEGGRLTLSSSTGGSAAEGLEVVFDTDHCYSWLPAGMSSELVVHRPDLRINVLYKGQRYQGRGYSKRYFGEYGPHWGYRFIQSSALDDDQFLWTADATFRLGDGEAKYNYFKLLNGRSGELIQAQSEDTYQQDSAGFAEIEGVKYVARIDPLDEWLHDYKAGATNSRMQLRYCKLSVSRLDTGVAWQGYALNERCFGVLG
mmetsp:Transcript_32975/g.60372  ORF Transcript_32975/g.60372 Transcript_32975/m.60372 type:complete len:339 (+) Transcript_32975:55-1071(+)